MSQQAQFNLRIIAGDDIVISFSRYEQGPYFPPLFRADRNILKIGIRTAESSRRRYHLVKGRVNPTRFPGNQRFQSFEIGRNQFLQCPEL